ncbi:6-bladed beta-propeller [Bacteroides sp. 51]|uniref:6-bladed beta-propeller n=1 Tax=Bacteroides sp. 51 TaxID=2302938 RepID=UPI0013D4E0A2|nr:6-bladed beta-propeller [Bacteroides sp. 51]NDV81662.1 6-bladed beta-propeller [Bacteroides sp. 51]
MKKGCLLFLLVGLLSSCKQAGPLSNRNIKTIDIKLDEIKPLPEAAFQDFIFLELETRDDCLLEDISKTVFDDDFIYILSSFGGNIYIFQKNGQYISKLKQGSGPGELVFATDFYVDNDRIYVLDVYRKIKEYDLSGKYLKETDLESPFFLISKHNQSLFLFDPNLGKNNDYHLAIYENGEKSSFLKKKDEFKRVGYMPTNVFVETNNQNMLISHMLSDTIYQYNDEDKSVLASYYIDFHGMSVNSKTIEMRDPRMYQKVCKDNDYIGGIYRLAFFEDQLFFSFEYKKSVYAFYNTDTENVDLYANLLSQLPNPTKIVGKNKKELICVYYMNDLHEYFEDNSPVGDKADKLRSLSSDVEKNPILVILNM